MKKEIFAENTKKTDSFVKKSEISFIVTAALLLFVFVLCSIFVFNVTAKTSADTVKSNPYDLPEVSNEQLKDMKVSNNETFISMLYVDGRYFVKSFKNSENPTVRDLIDISGVTLSENDILSEKEDTLLSKDMVVSVSRVKYEEKTTTENIPPKSGYGTYGKKEIVTRIKYVDGVMAESSVISEKVIKEPVDKPKSAPASSNTSGKLDLGNGIPTEYVRKIDNIRYTAYCPADAGGSTTATGVATRVGYVAVDPRVIPMYSKLYLVTYDGFVYGVSYAMDTGGAIKGNRIDLFFNSSAECYNFGVRYGVAYIIK